MNENILAFNFAMFLFTALLTSYEMIIRKKGKSIAKKASFFSADWTLSYKYNNYVAKYFTGTLKFFTYAGMFAGIVYFNSDYVQVTVVVPIMTVFSFILILTIYICDVFDINRLLKRFMLFTKFSDGNLYSFRKIGSLLVLAVYSILVFLAWPEILYSIPM